MIRIFKVEIDDSLRGAENDIFRLERAYGAEEVKTGHWIEHDSESLREIGYYRCSECNHGYQRYERGVRKSEVPYINGQKYELHRIDKFCPNCGAKMIGKEKV